MNDINVNKSLGPDNLHPKLLLELRNHLVKPLTKLYNLCIEQGIVPQDWKVANVVPLFKKGKRDK